MHICFLSNGYGEDRCAAIIAKELKELSPQSTVSGAPLITTGEEYVKRGIPVLTHGKVPPSGGFPTNSLRGLCLDIFCTPRYFNYYRKLKKLRSEIDCVMAVGDVALMVLGHLSLQREIVFMATAKSDYKGTHYNIEETLMRSIPRKVLTRDDFTHENLRGRNVDALFLGNPIMDELETSGIELGAPPLIGILPGSRAEAYANLRKILAVVENIPEKASYACALPASMGAEKVAQVAKRDGWDFEKGALRKNKKTIALIEHGFSDVINKADVVIGLAGTANEQAAGVGKPVVSFAGYGPQTTVKRMTDQEKMLGGAVKYIADYPNGVVSEISYLLANPDEASKRGQIGALRMGPPGASKAIAALLVKEFGL